MSDPSFVKMATKTATTKRAAMTAGLSAAPTANLSGIACTPIDPVTAETMARLKLDSAYQTFETFIETGLDVKKGDTFTVSAVDYLVRYVEPRDWLTTTYLHVVLEKVGNG